MTERRDVEVCFMEYENERVVEMTIDWPPARIFEHLTNQIITPELPMIEITQQYKLRNVKQKSLFGHKDRVVYVLIDEHVNGGYSDGD